MAKKEESNTALLDPPKVAEAVVNVPTPAPKPVKFEMPRPDIDGVVQWFPRGERSTPKRAYVIGIYNERIKLFVPEERLAPNKTCMHVDDPGVLERPDAVRDESAGTWDFSIQEKRMKERDEFFTRELLEMAMKVKSLEKSNADFIDVVKSLELRLNCKS